VREKSRITRKRKEATMANRREELTGMEVEVERAKAVARDLGGRALDCFEEEGAPAHFRRVFWSEVAALESALGSSYAKRLREVGIALPEPEELGEVGLGPKLWEVVGGLASLQVWLTCSDHLSDRELYERLWHSVLPRGCYPPIPDAAIVIDCITLDENRRDLDYLRYYANDLARAMWQDQWPEKKLPDREALPFDRDRFLPRPPRVWWFDALSPATSGGGRRGKRRN
jgi:hypothetical protein